MLRGQLSKKVKSVQGVSVLNTEYYMSAEGTEGHNCVVKTHPERSFLN